MKAFTDYGSSGARIRVCVSSADWVMRQGWGVYADLRDMAGKAFLGGETQLDLKCKQEFRGQGRVRDGRFMEGGNVRVWKDCKKSPLSMEVGGGWEVGRLGGRRAGARSKTLNSF